MVGGRCRVRGGFGSVAAGAGGRETSREMACVPVMCGGCLRNCERTAKRARRSVTEAAVSVCLDL